MIRVVSEASGESSPGSANRSRLVIVDEDEVAGGDSQRLEELEEEVFGLRREQERSVNLKGELAGVLMSLYGIGTIIATLYHSARIIAEDGFWAWVIWGWFVASVAGALWPLTVFLL